MLKKLLRVLEGAYMKTFITAVLKYIVQDRIQYQLYAEFFRLNGIYVWEKLLISDLEPDQDVREELEGTLAYRITGNNIVSLPLSYRVQNRLLDYFNSIFAKNLKKTEYEEAYPILKKVYFDNDLFIAGVTLQYFRMKNSATSVIEEAGMRFERAAKKLESTIPSEMLKRNRHLSYARLYCWQKANFAYYLCGKSMAKSVEELSQQCISNLKIYNNFTNMWVLLGMINDNVDRKILDSISAYERALRMNDLLPFESSIYYWIGKRCEGYNNFKGIMMESYNRAYALDRKYRIIYKKAMMYMWEDNWEEAMNTFYECLERIYIKGDYLDPLEQEYIFKVKIQIGFIYLTKLKKYRRCIDVLKQALDLKEQIWKGKKQVNSSTAFYFDLYGKEKAEEYIQIELSRMGCRQAYQYLSKAYEYLGDWDESERYWALAKQ